MNRPRTVATGDLSSRYKPTRIRFDDTLWATSDPKLKGKELQKFSKNVEWCFKTGVPLTPAILCQEVEKFPGALEKLQAWIKEGVIACDLHGWDHGPYGDRTEAYVTEHLELALEWFDAKLDSYPIRWVTPHGANSPEMQAAAAKFNLVIETTQPPVIDQKQLDTMLRETRDLTVMNGRVIMNHWWERGLRLYRIAKIIEHQNVMEAIAETRALLTPADHKICWAGWTRL